MSETLTATHATLPPLTTKEVAELIDQLKNPETYETNNGSAPLECDLVMKGGVTSGIVYPLAICELARQYVFRRIGGTSAGAISAAATAAAELGRCRSGGNGAGFAELADLPFVLGKVEGTASATRLETLFQPQPTTQRLFQALLTFTDHDSSIWRKAVTMMALWPSVVLPFMVSVLASLAMMVSGVVFGIQALPVLGPIFWFLLATFAVFIAMYRIRQSDPPWTVIGLAAIPLLFGALAYLTWTMHLPESTLLTVFAVAGFLLLLVLVFWALYLKPGVLAEVQRYTDNDYGLCHGNTNRSFKSKGVSKELTGLTDWLEQYLDTLAGKKPGDPPLTFGELWDATLSTLRPAEIKLEQTIRTALETRVLQDRQAPNVVLVEDEKKTIDLRVISTCLTHGRPYTFPNDREDIYFKPSELEHFFSGRVVRHMVAHTRTDSKTVRLIIKQSQENATKENVAYPLEQHDLFALPAARDLPVIFAVRMSLSFPVLFSMVPLWAKDYRSKRNLKPGRITNLEKIWFTDGGISSNFPVHLFDDPLPARPAFALNLRSPGATEKVHDFRKQTFDQGTLSSPSNNDFLNQRDQVVLLKRGFTDFIEAEAASDGEPINLQNGQARNVSDTQVHAADWWWRIGAELDRSNDKQRNALAHATDAFTQIFESARNWQDNTMMRLPGFYDRVVHVLLEGWEGGLNLKMPMPLIAGVAIRGWWAGYTLRTSFDLEQHQVVRGGITAIMYANWLKQLDQKWTTEKLSDTYKKLFAQPYTVERRPHRAGEPSRIEQHPDAMSGLHNVFEELVTQKDKWGNAVGQFQKFSDFANPPDLKTRARY